MDTSGGTRGGIIELSVDCLPYSSLFCRCTYAVAVPAGAKVDLVRRDRQGRHLCPEVPHTRSFAVLPQEQADHHARQVSHPIHKLPSPHSGTRRQSRQDLGNDYLRMRTSKIRPVTSRSHVSTPHGDSGYGDRPLTSRRSKQPSIWSSPTSPVPAPHSQLTGTSLEPD